MNEWISNLNKYHSSGQNQEKKPKQFSAKMTMMMIAPTATLETVTIVRPLKVIALICNILVDLLMILCLLSTNWLTTIKYRQGLWQYCIDIDSPRPLPFGLDDHDGCHWGRNAAYIKLSGFFAVACFLLAIIATILTSFGLSSRDPNKKYTFYRFALYINLGALLAIIVSLTLYPAFFYSELHHTNMVPSNRPHWYFGWAYGVGWGAAIFLIGAILLLVCDKETEEIYYQERTIVHANNGGASNHLLQHQHQHQLTNNHHHHSNNHQQSIKA
ncbi:transmembrane protein 47 isoform X1 [Dermatophagoides pteronyssinus]|uniref:transmembrane protein 47 isoform X1 n=2 Tax=Dermatophagoides pteronyssinus TaxID=6956 RepID=UPI003F671B2F